MTGIAPYEELVYSTFYIRTKTSANRSRDAESASGRYAIREACATVSDPAMLVQVVKGTAAMDSGVATGRADRVHLRLGQVLPHSIRATFPHVAAHIINTQLVGFLLPNREGGQATLA